MFVFRREELKEDNNEAKIGTEWWLIRYKDYPSFYLPFIVFKRTLVLFCKDISICFEVKKSFWHAFVNTFESKACDWIKPVVQPLDLLCISLGDKINIEMNAGNKLNVRKRENMEKVSSKLKTDPWLMSPWSSFQFSRSMQTWSSKSDKNCSQVQGMIT